MHMPGGVITYGSAEITDFCDTFEKADKIAHAVYLQNKGQPDLHIWVMRCLKTYQNGGIAVEKKPTKTCGVPEHISQALNEGDGVYRHDNEIPPVPLLQLLPRAEQTAKVLASRYAYARGRRIR